MTEHNRQLTIGFDVTWMNVNNSSGGVYHYALMLITALVKRGRVRIIAIISSAGRGIFDHLSGNASLTVVCMEDATSFYDIIASERVDVVHTPIQSFANMTLSVPMISTLHDLQHVHYPDFFSSEEIDYRNTYYKKSAEISERVIVSFNHVKDDIVNYFSIPAGKIDVCPIGMPEPRMFDDTVAQEVLNRYRISGDYLFYPASTWRHKNHVGLIRALKSVHAQQGIMINLVCPGNTKYDHFSEIRSLVHELQLDDHVHFTGYIPDDDLHVLLKKAALVVIPTLYEAGSLPLMEAMANEVPVICSKVTSLPETIGDPAFTFDPLDHAQIAILIAQMLGSASLRQKNRDNSRTMASKSSWDKVTPIFEAAYEKAVRQFEEKKQISYYQNWIVNYDCISSRTIHDANTRLQRAEKDRADRLDVIHQQGIQIGSMQNNASRLTADLQSLEAKCERSEKQLQITEAKLHVAESHLSELDRELASLKGSLSWRVTAPFRRILNIYRSLKKN